MADICLCMIVRDEERILPETLDSIVPLVRSWLVVDTGSSDGTIDLVQRYFEATRLPGEVIERPWVDFGHNRTEALDLGRARAGYVWMHDADDVVVGAPPLDQLSAAAYDLRYRSSDALTSWRTQIFRSDVPWRFVGALHERPVADGTVDIRRIEGDYHVSARARGYRARRHNRAWLDRELLDQCLDRAPDDDHVMFFLAQSCEEVGDLAAAEHWYRRRATLGGDPELVFLSLHRRARLLEATGNSPGEVQAAYLQAWEARPSRREPLMELVRIHRAGGDHRQARLFAEAALRIPLPDADRVAVAADQYEWRTLDELAVINAHLGQIEEGLVHARRALTAETLRGDDRKRIEANVARLSHLREGPLDIEPSDGAVEPIGSAPAGSAFVEPLTHPPIEVINLARRPDRARELRRAVVRSLGMHEAERLRLREAVDGRSLPANEELDRLLDGNTFGRRRGVVGQFLSHLAVWGDAAEGPEPGTIVLEDDARPSSDLLDDLAWCLEMAREELGPWDLIVLGYHRRDRRSWDPRPAVSRGVVPMRWERYGGGSFGYIVSPGGAAKLIELLAANGMTRPLAGFLLEHRQELVVGEARPGLVWAPLAVAGVDADSDVRHDDQPIPTA